MSRSLDMAPKSRTLSDIAPLVDLKELHNAQHDVIYVAEARGLSLLGMVHATCA